MIKGFGYTNWQRILIPVFLIALLIFIAYVMTPLLDGIALGLVFAYVARPIKKLLNSHFRLGNRVSSLLGTGMLIVPIALIFTVGIVEAAQQLSWVLQNQGIIITTLKDALTSFGASQDFVNGAVNLIQQTIATRPIETFLNYSNTVNIGILILNLLLSIIICYFLLADGKSLVDAVFSIIPENGRIGPLINAADRTISGIYVGNFLAAILISIITIPFLYAFRIPLIAVLAALMFLAALIPIFAEWMVLLPVTLYVIYTGGPIVGAQFLILGTIVLYIVPELILRPYLIGKVSSVHPLLILLSFLGGGIVGGIAGFFLAPVAVGVIIAAYNVYTKSDVKSDRI